MTFIEDSKLRKEMAYIYKSHIAREYMQTAIAGRTVKEIPAQELTSILTRAVELSKES